MHKCALTHTHIALLNDKEKKKKKKLCDVKVDPNSVLLLKLSVDSGK